MNLSERKAEISALNLDGTEWERLEGDKAEWLEKELHLELGQGHVLFDRYVAVVAWFDDDVLCITDDPEFAYAIVHLTWNRHPEPPPWPSTGRYRNLEELSKDLI